MRCRQMIMLLAWAWTPLLLVAPLDSAGARGDVLERDPAMANALLSARFEPTRYDYPSTLLERSVPLTYGAAQEAVKVGPHAQKIFELVVSSHDQGDLDNDGFEEAILLVEESLCADTCTTQLSLDIWSTRGHQIVRISRIPLAPTYDVERIGAHIAQGLIHLSYVDTDASGDLREVSERWKTEVQSPRLMDRTLGDYVDDVDGPGC